jgi:hypothetical protein
VFVLGLCLPSNVPGAKTLSITTFGIMTLSIEAFFATLNINDTQHNDTQLK